MTDEDVDGTVGVDDTRELENTLDGAFECDNENTDDGVDGFQTNSDGIVPNGLLVEETVDTRAEIDDTRGVDNHLVVEPNCDEDNTLIDAVDLGVDWDRCFEGNISSGDDLVVDNDAEANAESAVNCELAKNVVKGVDSDAAGVNCEAANNVVGGVDSDVAGVNCEAVNKVVGGVDSDAAGVNCEAANNVVGGVDSDVAGVNCEAVNKVVGGVDSDAAGVNCEAGNNLVEGSESDPASDNNTVVNSDIASDSAVDDTTVDIVADAFELTTMDVCEDGVGDEDVDSDIASDSGVGDNTVDIVSDAFELTTMDMYEDVDGDIVSD